MSEHQALVDAIHKLEIGLTERIHLQTTALEINNERLDNLRIAVDRHRIILYGHEDGDNLGLVTQMQELKKTEKERRLTLRGVTAAFTALVGKFCWDLWP